MESQELSYDEARLSLAQALLRDAQLQESGEGERVGADYMELYRVLPGTSRPEHVKFDIATTFWDCWLDAVHNDSAYPGIARSEWPDLARKIADDLINNREISDPRVLENFKVESGPGCLSAMTTLLFRRSPKQTRRP